MNSQLVVVAIDHSVQSQNAVKFYLEKMHKPGNKLILVHCIELPNINEARECNMSPGVLASLWKEEEAKTKMLEENMKVLLKDKNISARLRNVRGKPGEMLCHIAAEEKSVCIIIGCRGMGTLKRTIVGSVSDFVLKHACCPVIVCRDPSDPTITSETKRNRHSSEKTPLKATSFKNQSLCGEGPGAQSMSLASQLRRRFASGSRGSMGFSQTGSMSMSEEVKEELAKFERTVVLYE
ncbi:hypothetical protein HELRODRAFT_194477 [Helobdella robusta]|uniref:UspA domain-containing protein n=1 Tax=Helobdella robusta TaxID=6412 RepID=T1FW35_HELRO|nr:hypothetical protein HELRODRAFT_194477 [Helobdella robusta]ESN92002.1 hypothetical protein HELRODRAFT_194477 [Helobdella robusta]